MELFDKLAVEIQYRKIPKGQIIFFAGDRRERLFLLSQGYVRIEQYDSTDTFSHRHRWLRPWTGDGLRGFVAVQANLS